MTLHFLWLEGVDFDLHVGDTNELSTMRGASLALLKAGEKARDYLVESHEALKPELVFSGASLALFRLHGDAGSVAAAREGLGGFLADGERTGKIPLQHLRFVIGVAACADGDEKAAIQQAHSDARMRQMTGDFHRPVIGPDERMCLMSRVWPANETIPLPAAQAADLTGDILREEPKRGETRPVPVSNSVKERRAYGRDARQQFYKDRLEISDTEAEGYRFTDNLHDMVADPPAGLAENLRKKIAVLYADGNGFTAIRNAMGGDGDAYQRFSRKADAVMRDRVLAPLLAKARAKLHDPAATKEDRQAYALLVDDKPQIRFETLMYGGDEVAFVMPAWLAVEAAAAMLGALTGDGGADVDGHKLHFAVGLATGSYKTPIKLLRANAEALAEHCKSVSKDRTCIAIQISESVEASLGGIYPAWNAVVFGQDRQTGNETGKRAMATLALDGRVFVETALPALRELVREDTVPRSQLYRWLRMVRNRGGDGAISGLAGTDADNRIREAIRTWNGRAGENRFPDGLLTAFGDKMPPALAVWLTTQLWDYVEPLGAVGAAYKEAAE